MFGTTNQGAMTEQANKKDFQFILVHCDT